MTRIATFQARGAIGACPVMVADGGIAPTAPQVGKTAMTELQMARWLVWIAKWFLFCAICKCSAEHDWGSAVFGAVFFIHAIKFDLFLTGKGPA